MEIKPVLEPTAKAGSSSRSDVFSRLIQQREMRPELSKHSVTVVGMVRTMDSIPPLSRKVRPASNVIALTLSRCKNASEVGRKLESVE
jgi:hypothetical protein